jgi:hypothetical protein
LVLGHYQLIDQWRRGGDPLWLTSGSTPAAVMPAGPRHRRHRPRDWKALPGCAKRGRRRPATSRRMGAAVAGVGGSGRSGGTATAGAAWRAIRPTTFLPMRLRSGRSGEAAWGALYGCHVPAPLMEISAASLRSLLHRLAVDSDVHLVPVARAAFSSSARSRWRVASSAEGAGTSSDEPFIPADMMIDRLLLQSRSPLGLHGWRCITDRREPPQ